MVQSTESAVRVVRPPMVTVGPKGSERVPIPAKNCCRVFDFDPRRHSEWVKECLGRHDPRFSTINRPFGILDLWILVECQIQCLLIVEG